MNQDVDSMRIFRKLKSIEKISICNIGFRWILGVEFQRGRSTLIEGIDLQKIDRLGRQFDKKIFRNQLNRSMRSFGGMNFAFRRFQVGRTNRKVQGADQP